MTATTAESLLEALLFSAGEPVSVEALSRGAHIDRETTEEALERLRVRYRDSVSGLGLIFHEGIVELTTKPELGEFVQEFVKFKMQDALSKAALETLSVIAYRGPVSRSDIEAIRGVNCQFTLRNLLLRGLIERQDVDAIRGYSYMVSFDFLKHLGLERTEDLPEFDILSRDERLVVIQEGQTTASLQ